MLQGGSSASHEMSLTAQLTWVETWLNRPDVKKSLGVPSKLTFTGCNMEVNKAFMMQGDGMHNSAELIPPMLDAGIRFLICAYARDLISLDAFARRVAGSLIRGPRLTLCPDAGELDFMVCPPLPRACLTRQCNWIGNRDWVLKLENRYHQELIEAKPKTWTGHRGKLAGEVTAAGNGSFAFIKVARSGCVSTLLRQTLMPADTWSARSKLHPLIPSGARRPARERRLHVRALDRRQADRGQVIAAAGVDRSGRASVDSLAHLYHHLNVCNVSLARSGCAQRVAVAPQSSTGRCARSAAAQRLHASRCLR